MNARKRIALVAHDNRKNDMVEWVRWNYKVLMGHQLICTGTTGRMVEEALQQEIGQDPDIPEKKKNSPLRIIRLNSNFEITHVL